MKTRADWQILIEGLLEAVLLVDCGDLRVIAVNRNACKLLGVGPEDLVGHSVTQFVGTPEDLFFWEECAAGLSDQIRSASLLRRPDGFILDVERRVTRIVPKDTPPFYLVGITDQSGQRRVEDELEKIVAELRATLESTADGILVVDPDNGIRSYNHRFAELWDIPYDLLTQRDDAAVHAWLADNVADGEADASRLAAYRASPLLEGTDVIHLRSGRVLERVSLPQYARGHAIGRVYSFRDITRRLADQRRLELAAKVFASTLDAILITDADYRIVAANPEAVRLTGYGEEELPGLSIGDLLDRSGEGNFFELLKVRLLDNGYWEGEILQRRKDGTTNPILCSVVNAVDDDESGPQHLVFFKDLTERQTAKLRIEELAYHDALTGLPNRLLLGDRIDVALKSAAREGRSFAVLFIDLDHFKQINDSLGHAFGDRVLVTAAERIKTCLRPIDTAARLGGDEFVLVLHEVDQHQTEMIARRILESLANPVALDNMTFALTCSIGIVLYPADGANADELIKNADTAMYQVKERGRAGYRFYQRQMNVDLLARMKRDQAMRQALDQGHFRLHYQPQVDTTGCIIGAEALIRWYDPEQGLITPDQFIPIAEQTGFIVPIGEWVLTEAIKQTARWLHKGIDLTVAVNVSALQFQKPDFALSVAREIRQHGLQPEALELELTESILIQDADDALLRLNALAQLGVRLSIDDFGTGYSSLAYLKNFPIHKLKIDRSFVRGLPANGSDAAIVNAVINLGHTLSLDVIAEGVETLDQKAFLDQAGCDQYQGFLFSQAVDAESFEILARRSVASPLDEEGYVKAESRKVEGRE
ncbi:MAG TPA: EAL domain-containing protein [Rhodocyclaceae bacterium]|nr:EAL domain-containing protein [Rhodocyclaceae bacterium]